MVAEARLVWHDEKVGWWEPDEGEPGQAQACINFTCSVNSNPTNSAERTGELVTAVSAALATVAASEGMAVAHTVDLLAVCPCRLPLLPEGLPEVLVGPSTPVAELMRRCGLAAWERDAVCPQLLERLKAHASACIARADAALRERGVHVGTELFRLREMSARGVQRFDLLLDLGTADAAAVMEAAREAAWAPVVRRMLGDDAAVQVSVVYSRPGASEQEWHSDGPHVGTVAGWDGEGATPPYALCVFVPLVNLDVTVGFTQFWLGTHIYRELIGFGGLSSVLSSATDGMVEAGGAVMYDYRLMHRGMPNRSAATERPVLQFLYHHPDYRERANYGDEPLFSVPFVQASATPFRK